MKIKLLLSGLLFLSCFSAVATTDTLLLKCLHYENSSGEKGKTTLYYSENRKNYKARWELLDGSRYSINYHFLNENNNLIQKFREFSDSITSNNFYKYDNNGNMIEDYFERSDGVKGIVWYKYKDGRRVEAECRGLNGWFYGIIRYEYGSGKLEKGRLFSDGNEVGFIEYKYNDNNYLIKEFWDFGGKWNQTFTYEYFKPEEKPVENYTYSNPFLKETGEHKVKTENYDWNNEQGGPSEYVYEGNKLVQKIYEYDSLETITSYEYDNEGLLMKSFRNYSDGRKAEFSYHFNEDRQLIRRLFHGENGFTGSELYKYDENGRLVEAQWDKFDSWLTGIITFDYNEENRLKSGLFKGKNGYGANIDFESDTNNNITNIHWTFTFNKTQSYWFKYED